MDFPLILDLNLKEFYHEVRAPELHYTAGEKGCVLTKHIQYATFMETGTVYLQTVSFDSHYYEIFLENIIEPHPFVIYSNSHIVSELKFIEASKHHRLEHDVMWIEWIKFTSTTSWEIKI